MFGTQVELVLDAVDPWTGESSTDDSFVLMFTGPLEPVLASEWVDLVPAGAASMTLFLVPNGPAQGRMRYEAIFNRAVPK